MRTLTEALQKESDALLKKFVEGRGGYNKLLTEQIYRDYVGKKIVDIYEGLYADHKACCRKCLNKALEAMVKSGKL